MNKPRNFIQLLSVIILILLISTGCGSKTAVLESEANATSEPVSQGDSNTAQTISPSEEAAVPTTTEPGTTRVSPLALNTLLSIPGWDIKVLQFLRGAEAMNVINTAEWQAKPLPDGQEYALAKIYVKCTALDDNYHTLGIPEVFITGSSNVAFGDSMDGWPQPEFLYEDMYTADEVEGWIDAIIPTEEQNLMVGLNVKQDDVLYTRYFALQEGASIALPSELTNLSPNELGVDYTQPAQAGQKVISPDWEVTVLNSLSGAEADTALGKGTPEYTAPSDGMEYLLVNVKVKNISTNDIPVFLGVDNFYPVDPSNGWRLPTDRIYLWGQSDLVWLNKTLLPGAETEGWVFTTIPTGTAQPIVAFDPDYSASQSTEGNLRYLLIK